ncbi:unnamed protein product [Strongylus vulgaris]|uniref:Helicase ATP-binding domain-containing protein n=1 Tax=Strongylus vulgaris TaxID=40348 RepID=A0A3P7IDJ1_STRVU|nr:unnamed protein product [Strongylus vulgaris]
METPGRVHEFFQRRNAKGRGSGRKLRNRDPWQEPKADESGEYGQDNSQKIVTPMVFKPKKRKREKLLIDNSQYEKMPICGIEVRLPVGLKPYPSQKLMMVRIITALTKRLNLLAESPTGSGKTMALLASSCAWLEDYKKKRHEARSTCPIHRANSEAEMASGLSSEVPAKHQPNNPETDAENIKLEIKVEPTPITPTSKTSSLYDDEFLNDFSGSPAPPQSNVKNVSSSKVEHKECLCLPFVLNDHSSALCLGYSHTVMASREQSCINVAARESADVSGYCKELLSAGGMGCRFKDAMKGRFERPQYVRFALEQMNSVVFDIEQLVDSLSSMSTPICPYFSSTRILTQDADIIFCPFSYIVDPIIRNSSDVHLKNSVVILDEAHNIEDNCREAASFTFFEKEVSDSLGSLREKGEFGVL